MLRGGAAGGTGVARGRADTVREVALRKALDAFSVLREPLVVRCGLCVAALGDWPGPYTKNANDKLGTEGLLRLLDGVTDRRAGWDDTIVYVDGDGDGNVFGPSETRLASERYGGEISVSPPKKIERFRGPERAGSMFVPTKFGLTECRGRVRGGLPAVQEGSAVRVERVREVLGTTRSDGDVVERTYRYKIPLARVRLLACLIVNARETSAITPCPRAKPARRSRRTPPPPPRTRPSRILRTRRRRRRSPSPSPFYF